MKDIRKSKILKIVNKHFSNDMNESEVFTTTYNYEVAKESQELFRREAFSIVDETHGF